MAPSSLRLELRRRCRTQRRSELGARRKRLSRPGTTRGAVYLAGPSGFFEAGLLWHNTVVLPKVVAAGLVPKDPWADQSAIADVLEATKVGPERRRALQAANLVQGRNDLHLITESEAILASLDGQDVDSGTALEIGYGFALGLLIVGLRTDIRRCSDNEGSVVNLMIRAPATRRAPKSNLSGRPAPGRCLTRWCRKREKMVANCTRASPGDLAALLNRSRSAPEQRS